MSTISIAPMTAGSFTGAAVRLTRRGRAVVLAAFVAVLAALMVAFGGMAAGTLHHGRPTPVHYVEVGPGDTLYGYAAKIAAPGHVLDVVNQIEQLNSLTGPQLQVGQRLAIPTRG